MFNVVREDDCSRTSTGLVIVCFVSLEYTNQPENSKTSRCDLEYSADGLFVTRMGDGRDKAFLVSAPPGWVTVETRPF